ncbi:MAG: hypothetical protein J6K51_04530 [Clostridia bacterium]|nr:hypothetical protein [Clostridia bacterium]
MKRLSVLFLVLTLIVSSFTVVSAASGAEKVMSDFNVMPMTCSADSDNLVTRRDFAYTIANILGSGEAEPRDTEYVDVTADMEDSGYIYMATVNGFLPTTGNMFCPDDPISFHDFNQAVVKLLAYETIAATNGGGEGGNMKTVMDLHLYDGVNADNYDTVTATQYRKLIYNLLTANVTDFSYSYDADGNVNLNRTGASKTILSQYFSISRYYGSIVEVNNDKPSAKFTVTKNVSEVNPTMLTVGGTYTFLSNGKVDLNFYKNIPVEVWTDKDGIIVYIAPQSNVRVFYDVIYGVNNDTNENNAYAINLINEIEFNSEKKEYRVAPGAQVSYNGEIVTYPVKLAKKYAKIVMIDNKVTFIETWNLTEGGMVTEINNSYISYIKGETEGRVKNIGLYDDIIVVVEGRSTDRNQIKPGSLFHYYQTDTLLVIVVSEKTIVGNLESYSAGVEMEIGRHFYPTYTDVYCSEDGEEYIPNDFNRMFGTKVICYLDIFGNIRYMKSGGYLQDENIFTAYVIGHSTKAFEDTKIKVQKIYPEIEEAIITLPVGFTNYVDNPATTTYNATNLQNNLLNPLNWSLRTTAYEKLYKFNVNQDGEITEISEPDYFLMYGEAHTVEQLQADGTTVSTTIPAVPVIDAHLVDFPNDGGTRAFLCLGGTNPVYTGLGSSSANANYFYNHGEHFVVLCNDNGKIKPMETSFSEMGGKGPYDTITDMRIAMLAEPGASTPYVWVIYGNTDKIYQYQGDTTSEIETITQKYDVETDAAYYEIVLDDGKLTWKLDSIAFSDHPEWTVASSESGGTYTETKLEPGMKIGYLEDAIFNDNEVYITDVTIYPQITSGLTMEEWAKRNIDGYLIGTVKKITDYRLFLENGGAYHLANNCSIIGIKLDGNQVKEVSLSEAEVPSGATVYYNRTFGVSTIYVEYTE